MLIPVQITDFNGGMTDDRRLGWSGSKSGWSTNKFAVTKHFDSHSYPKKLVPYYQALTYNQATTNLGIQKFLYAPTTAGGFRLYGLGSSSSKPAVYSLDVSDIANNAWGSPANNVAINTSYSTDCFFYYKGYIYIWGNSQYLQRFDTQGGVWNDNVGTVAFTSVAQAVHMKIDDIAYFFSNNLASTGLSTTLVHKVVGTTFTGSILTLPNNLIITSACEYGSYLAIGCVTVGAFDSHSYVYLWDRDSSLATVSEMIDMGSGKLLKLVNLNGNLIGIVNNKIGDTNDLNQGAYFIKQAVGSFGVTINTITTDDGNAYLPASGLPDGVVKDGKLYIALGAGLNGDSRLGIWEIDSSGRASLGYVEPNATLYLTGIYPIDNSWFVSYANGSYTTIISHTDTSRTYDGTNPSIYESLIFNAGDSSLLKKLVGITVTHEPPTSNRTVTVKYRKNNETSWTTIYSDTNNSGNLFYEATNLAAGGNLPEFYEIQFQINSFGAKITGLKFKVEVEDSTKY